MPKKLSDKDTHKIEFSKNGHTPVRQGAIGKTDLFNIIREVLKDGYTKITITVVD